MDMMTMIMNAKITDMGGEEVGDVVSIHIVGCKMFITANMGYDIEEDGDDGEKDDIPEDDASKASLAEVISLVAGGKSG